MRRFSGSVSVIPYGKPNPLISKRQGGLPKFLQTVWKRLSGVSGDGVMPAFDAEVAAKNSIPRHARMAAIIAPTPRILRTRRRL